MNRYLDFENDIENIEKIINELDVTNILLSISDTSHYSTAIVITENNGSS